MRISFRLKCSSWCGGSAASNGGSWWPLVMVGGGGGSVKAWVGVWREKVKNHVFHVEERIYNL